MQRRDVLRSLGAMALGPMLAPVSGAERYLLGVRLHEAAQGPPRALTGAQAALVAALADTIIPRTDTPGALDTGAVPFFDRLLAEWHTESERRELLAGLDALDARCREATGFPYAELPPGARAGFLGPIDAAAAQAEPGSPEAAYGRIRQCTIYAFLTSQPIREGVFRNQVIPGRFDGCIPV